MSVLHATCITYHSTYHMYCDMLCDGYHNYSAEFLSVQFNTTNTCSEDRTYCTITISPP